MKTEQKDVFEDIGTVTLGQKGDALPGQSNSSLWSLQSTVPSQRRSQSNILEPSLQKKASQFGGGRGGVVSYVG